MTTLKNKKLVFDHLIHFCRVKSGVVNKWPTVALLPAECSRRSPPGPFRGEAAHERDRVVELPGGGHVRGGGPLRGRAPRRVRAILALRARRHLPRTRVVAEGDSLPHVMISLWTTDRAEC